MEKGRQNISNNRFHNPGHQAMQKRIPERQERKEGALWLPCILPGCSEGRGDGGGAWNTHWCEKTAESLVDRHGWTLQDTAPEMKNSEDYRRSPVSIQRSTDQRMCWREKPSERLREQCLCPPARLEKNPKFPGHWVENWGRSFVVGINEP